MLQFSKCWCFLNLQKWKRTDSVNEYCFEIEYNHFNSVRANINLQGCSNHGQSTEAALHCISMINEV